ncbi:ACT domain-containing protein [Neptunicella marina]|uniref:ACT domain-containing protein n=1 Tax=Neptunicella marina TaxID=2125989 RepID=A0A8J6IS53_9ALTE|nr:ACT domain-containing protein [Neptunicella marina]
MAGETDLEHILASLSPVLSEQEFVFCTFVHGQIGDFLGMEPMAHFVEPEGITLIVKRETAERFAVDFEGVFKCITLKVHSSLEAVGLTAAISQHLAAHHISANVVAAYYHDHVFVPVKLAYKAMHVLTELSEQYQQKAG